MPAIDRAVLVLVLVHSVAIPRSRGTLPGDAWTSGQPTMLAELQDASRIQPTDIRAALQRLRAAGLVQLVPQRVGVGQSAAYLPGPQLHRLTPAARRRLQEELILAAAPSSPLAAAIRARHATTRGIK
jgi:DNA-binding GntR family transcriptional regulator